MNLLWVDLIVELVFKEKAFPGQCCRKVTFSQVSVYCYLSASGLPKVDLLISSRQPLILKKIVSDSYLKCFNSMFLLMVGLESRISGLQFVLILLDRLF